jgi:anti-sigma regulatory factor (Ser/Thr protein kinase)
VAGGEGDVGGDWYDVFTLPDGRVCLVVGDVVGRGLHAAVVMGRLRSTVRAYALELDDPADVVARVDRKLQHFEPAEMATVQFAVLDPSFERLRLTSAGHPAPVVARPGEAARFVDVPADPPLGVRHGVPRRVTTVELAPGSVLCFYTDGLVERRGVPVDARLELLRSAVAAGPVDQVCAEVMLRLVGAGPPTDDTGVLVARRIDYGDTAPLDMVVPALASSLADIRAAMRRWLPAAGATKEDVNDLLVAVGEAASNVVEHAYGPQGGTITVRLEVQGSQIVATVCDAGRWRPPRGENRGRGTLLMERCSDVVDVERSEAGTQVLMRRAIGRGSWR